MTWTIEEYYDDRGIKFWEILDDDNNHIKHYDNANHPDNTTGIPGLRMPQDIRSLVFDQHEEEKERPDGSRVPIIARRGLEIVLDQDWQVVRKQIS